MAGAIMFTLTYSVRYSRRGNPRQVHNVPFRAYVNLALPTRSPASTPNSINQLLWIAQLSSDVPFHWFVANAADGLVIRAGEVETNNEKGRVRQRLWHFHFRLTDDKGVSG